MKPFEVTELKEVDDVDDANRLLASGDWIFLNSFVGLQLNFQKIEIPEKSDPSIKFTKIQPFSKQIKIYVLGRVQ